MGNQRAPELRQRWIHGHSARACWQLQRWILCAAKLQIGSPAAFGREQMRILE